MLVQKFGGTSVGSPERMRQVADLITDGEQKVVVLSAVAGTTNKLVALSADLLNGDKEGVKAKLKAFYEEYYPFVDELLPDADFNKEGRLVVEQQFGEIEALLAVASPSDREEKIILAQGELISTRLFTLYMQSTGRSTTLLPALDFMTTNQIGDPDVPLIRRELDKLIQSAPSATYYITQGYICRNFDGEVDNLQRGGSDYTATIIGAALYSPEIQIWTDIDGLHNNDPRIVKGTTPVREISYREAAELAYFGAKILHPTCVIPAENDEVPVRLKNTFEPDAPGTLISAKSSGMNITAIAAKDNITAIKIRSGRMLNAYGFLRRVFEIFEKYQTPIDMITTSEVSVSLTIDQTSNLEKIVAALNAFGEVSIEANQTIICIVGDNLGKEIGTPTQVLSALSDVPLRMVSYGGSNNNISLLVSSDYKSMALKALHAQLFGASVTV
ncbi:MAG: aspartate kinase [Saprospiraceae bacterium]|nr:aspartate kinase [Saprospiraceae bacterium]